MRRHMLALALFLAGPALADEDAVVLKDGAGKDAVEQNCSACHSLDYIEMNSPFLDQEKWAAEIKKMRVAFGAPISDDDAAEILAYLTTAYGP